jgi:hypothetical protein
MLDEKGGRPSLARPDRGRRPGHSIRPVQTVRVTVEPEDTLRDALEKMLLSVSGRHAASIPMGVHAGWSGSRPCWPIDQLQTAERDRQAALSMTTETLQPVEKPEAELSQAIRDRIDLIVTPSVLLLVAAAVGAVWVYTDFDSHHRSTSCPGTSSWPNITAHISDDVLVDAAGGGIAIPLGIFITRDPDSKVTPDHLAFANSGQAIPAFGLLVIFAGAMGRGTAHGHHRLHRVRSCFRCSVTRWWGSQQVDQATIEAARGMGIVQASGAEATSSSRWRSR